MSKMGVEIKIDVTKIEKPRLFVGKKGTYLTATVFIDTENDQFDNNGMIVHSQTKEEREKKLNTPILGNVKIFWSDDGPIGLQSLAAAQSSPEVTQVDNAPILDDDDDIPF